LLLHLDFFLPIKCLLKIQRIFDWKYIGCLECPLTNKFKFILYYYVEIFETVDESNGFHFKCIFTADIKFEPQSHIEKRFLETNVTIN
jgi:hypothetical protein